MPTWLLSPTVWLAAAAAGAALWGYVQTARLGGCQGELNGAKAQIAVLGAQMEAQNAAVQGLQAEGKARAAEAAKALQDARKRSEVGVAQAEALKRALAAHKALPDGSKPSACPAGDAAREVRRALAIR